MKKYDLPGFTLIILLMSLSIFCNAFEITNPSKGNAVIYIFRPDIDNVHKKDSPNLLINHKILTSIGYASYVKLELPLGKYNLSLTPNKTDSKSWNIETEFELKESTTYFVAIWNTKQPVQSGSVPVTLPGYVVFLPIANIFKGGKNSVMFESVSREIAEPTLENLRPVTIKED